MDYPSAAVMCHSRSTPAASDPVRHLREALGLRAHYEALDRVLGTEFDVERWLACLGGDDGLPIPVAAGTPDAGPDGRRVWLTGDADASVPGGPASFAVALTGLPAAALANLPATPFILADCSRYAAALTYRFRHRPFGLMLVGMKGGRAPLAAELEQLQRFAEDQVAPLGFREHAIEQVFHDRSLFTAKLEYLTEMGRLASNLDLTVLLNKIMELTMQFAAADVGSLILLEDNQPVTKLDWGLPHEALMALADTNGEPVFKRATNSPDPLWLDTDEFTVPPHLPYRFETVALLPLRTRDTWLGAVALVVAAPNPEFHPGKLDGLSAGLSLAATAVENAKLFQVKIERERELRNMEIASDIQQALLPRGIPDMQGIGVVGTNIAAKMIGGDYFDFFPFADGTLGIIVADVAGKGVAASLIMTSTRMLIRSIAAHDVPVEEVIRRTNTLLQAEACGGQFVTANYVRIDPRRLRMELCTAGHEPVLVYRPTEDRFLLAHSRALPLGITPEARYETETIPLRPGDLVFLYTDGIVEAMSRAKEQFGLERFQNTIRAACPDNIETIMHTILTAVDWHSAGMPRHDDTTLVVAEIKPTDSTHEEGGVVADNE